MCHLTMTSGVLRQLGDVGVALATLVWVLTSRTDQYTNHLTFRPLQCKPLWRYGGSKAPRNLLLSYLLASNGQWAPFWWESPTACTQNHPENTTQLRYQYAILTSFRNSMLIFYSVLVLDRSRFQKGSTHWRIWLVLADVICIHYPVLPSLLIGPWGHQTGQKLVCPNRARTRVWHAPHDIQCIFDTDTGCWTVDCHMASISLQVSIMF